MFTGGYVVPFGSVRCLFQASLQIPLFPLNDVHVTGFARIPCNIPVNGDSDAFTMFDIDLRSFSPHKIVVHR